MELREIRKNKNLTQIEAAELLGISLRSYKSYENDGNKENTTKYDNYCLILETLNRVDEEHSILKIDEIKKKVSFVMKKYQIKRCYLFGSYAKGNPNEKSDVDLAINSEITGLDFYGLVEELRNILLKKVDLIRINDLNNNPQLAMEILKDGILICG